MTGESLIIVVCYIFSAVVLQSWKVQNELSSKTDRLTDAFGHA